MYPNIAFFDSGQGGLTIWEKVVTQFPTLSTVYLGDNARCPYGNKSPDVIVEYAFQAGNFLAQKNAQFLAIVCGTASSVSAEKLNKKLSIPVVGIVEGLCEYTAKIIHDKTEPIAILATHYTIQSERFQKQLKEYKFTRVWSKACPLFVPLIENGISEGPMVDYACQLYLSDIPANIKVVLLACTHYPRIIKAIAHYLNIKTGRSVHLKTLNGEDMLYQSVSSQAEDNPIYLLDASITMVAAIKNFLDGFQNRKIIETNEHKLFCTDAPDHFEGVARYFTQKSIPKPELVNIVNSV